MGMLVAPSTVVLWVPGPLPASSVLACPASLTGTLPEPPPPPHPEMPGPVVQGSTIYSAGLPLSLSTASLPQGLSLTFSIVLSISQESIRAPLLAGSRAWDREREAPPQFLHFCGSVSTGESSSVAGGTANWHQSLVFDGTSGQRTKDE